MPSSISVIDVLVTEYNLDSLPVGESLRILFSNEPDLYCIDKHVAIVRVNSDQDVPNFSDLVYRIQDESEYGTVLCEYSTEESDLGTVLTVKPEEFLLPNSNYYLVTGKDLAPISYSLEKTLSIGPSEIYLDIKSTGNSEDAIYTLDTIVQSSLPSGQHNVAFKLSKDGVEVGDYLLDLKLNNKIELNDTVSIRIPPHVPFLLGEFWTINLEQFSRLGETSSQSFSTFLTSDVIENVEETSNRLDQNQILEFYSSTTWGEKEPEVLEPGQMTAEIKAIYKNVIQIDFSEEILVSSISTDSFDVIISYAFNNYLLPQMGYFNEDSKYIIKIKNTLQTATNLMFLEIEEDKEDLVPEDKKYLIQVL